MSPANPIHAAETVPLTPEQIAAACAALQPTPEQIEDRARRDAAMREAASQPLPGPLRDAFAAMPRELLGHPLADITAGHIAALVTIQSPGLEALRLGQLLASCEDEAERARLLAKAQDVKVEIIDVVEVLYIFTRAAAATRRMLAQRGGRASLRAAAEAILDTLPALLDWEVVKQALGAHYARCFVTHLYFEQKQDPGGSQSFPASHSTADSDGSLKP